MDAVKQSFLLLKTLYLNDRGRVRVKKSKNGKSNKVGTIVGFAILGVVFAVMFGFQSFFAAYATAIATPELLPSLLTVFYFIAQVVILFLGLFGTLGTLYFSKDNTLLMTLPIKKSAIFTAKFLYCYISELVISAAVVLVMVTAFGAGCIVGGVALSPWFFILEIISIFIVPVIPLLVIALLSIPMMYVVSLIKKSKLASAVLNSLIMLLFIGVCFVPSLMSLGMQGEDGMGGIAIYQGLAVGTVFNLPLTNSMFLVDAAANFFLYFGIMVVGFFAVIGLSSLTYPKIIASTVDSGAGSSKKKTKKAEYKALTFKKTYLKKELRILFTTPTILANLVLPVILLPIFTFVFAKTMSFSELGESSGFGAAGFILYMASIVSVAANPIAMMGFSMEGKNILFLKTLPLSASQMVRLKLKIADSINIVIGLIVFVAFSIASEKHDVLLAAIIGLSSIGLGIAFNRFGLYNDLKKPFLNWQNIQEINKNNKRTVKPMLICVGCCLVFLVLGFVLEAVESIALWLKYVLFAMTGLLVDSLIYICTAKKLFDRADELWENIEG